MMALASGELLDGSGHFSKDGHERELLLNRSRGTGLHTYSPMVALQVHHLNHLYGNSF